MYLRAAFGRPGDALANQRDLARGIELQLDQVELPAPTIVSPTLADEAIRGYWLPVPKLAPR
jgi:hypothetical protein